jgi:nucleotide-binding universal stress UspA family protein
MTAPIVAGVDPQRHDPEAAVLAALIARATGAPVIAVAVHPRDDRGAALARLSAVEAAFYGVELETVAVEAGSVAPALHELARARGAALIVVGSAHHGATGRITFGNTADRLLQRAPCPIAVAPLGFAERMRAIDRVGAAFIDTEEGNDALRAAAALAVACRAELDVARAVEPLAWNTPSATVPYDARAHQLELRARTTASMRRALDRLPPVARSRVHVLRGTPLAALERFTREVDVLVCGTRGYRGLHGVLRGAISRRLIHRAACPVIVVPPNTERRLERLAAPTLREAHHV